MKHTPTFALLGAAFVVGVGLLGFNGIIANPFTPQDTTSPTMKDGTHSLGHLTLVLKDPNGNIQAYRQTDNLVVETGKDCMTDHTFGSTGSCANPGLPFKYIAIGSATGTQSTADVALFGEYTRMASSTVLLTPALLTVGAIATQSAQFTMGTNTVIQQAGIFDTNLAGDMFAEEGFSAISTATNDQLTITWTVTTG